MNSLSPRPEWPRSDGAPARGKARQATTAVAAILVIVWTIQPISAKEEHEHHHRTPAAAGPSAGIAIAGRPKSPRRFPPRHSPTAFHPTARNAIGQRERRREAAPTLGQPQTGVRTPPVLPFTSKAPVRAGPASSFPTVPVSAAAGSVHGLPSALSPIVHPGSNAGAARAGRIDGTGLIRPALAPARIGGPAKVTAGINGTAFRPKH